jgi:hypothetical protein
MKNFLIWYMIFRFVSSHKKNLKVDLVSRVEIWRDLKRDLISFSWLMHSSKFDPLKCKDSIFFDRKKLMLFSSFVHIITSMNFLETYWNTHFVFLIKENKNVSIIRYRNLSLSVSASANCLLFLKVLIPIDS